MTGSLAMDIRIPLAFEAAVDATRAALKTEGFGILTDPAALLATAPAGMTEALRPVATDARQRMERVVKALRGGS